MTTRYLNRSFSDAFERRWQGVRQLLDQIRDARASRRVYRQAKAELSGLSNRALRDLGIDRSEIRRIAWEAAYGR